jgi:hypothetical protein
LLVSAHLPPPPPACTYVNIRGLVVKILTKIPAIVPQIWLDKDFYIIRQFTDVMISLSSVPPPRVSSFTSCILIGSSTRTSSVSMSWKISQFSQRSAEKRKQFKQIKSSSKVIKMDQWSREIWMTYRWTDGQTDRWTNKQTDR